MFDLIIKNGLIADGSGEKAYEADVAVKDGRIAKIAKNISEPAAETIDAKGRVVAPGFVDNHSHSDMVFLFGTDGANFLEQGITTEIAGMCGELLAPAYSGSFIAHRGMVPQSEIDRVAKICDSFKSFSAHVETMDMPTNMAFYIGHCSVRGRVMDFSDKKPTDAQLSEMKAIVKEGMECGMIGLTTGLIYPPSIYGDEDEIAALMEVVSQYGGTYCSHIRGEGDTLIEAIEECIRIGEKSGCNVVVSHHKVSGKHNKGKSNESLKRIDEANMRGKVKVIADQYPFIAGMTGLYSALPARYLTGGVDNLVENLKKPEFRAEVTALLKTHDFGSEDFIYYGGFEGCLVLEAFATPQYVAKNLLEIAQELNQDPYETMYDLIIANDGNVQMAYFIQNEEDMMNIIKHPTTCPGTDALHNVAKTDPEQVGGLHPRFVSTFPKHMRLVRENGFFSMEQAVRRATAIPAEFAGLKETGLLKEGYHADIVVFDWDKIGEHNDFIHPCRKNQGIDHVVVSGVLALKDGKITGKKAGRFLKREK